MISRVVSFALSKTIDFVFHAIELAAKLRRPARIEPWMDEFHRRK